MELAARIWNAIPAGLRKWVGGGIALGVAALIVLLGYLLYQSGYLKEKLGIDDIRKDIAQQTVQMEQVLPNAIDETVARYDSTLKQYLADERKLAEDTIMKPMLRAIVELDRQQQKMLRGMGASTESMEQRTRAIDEQLTRLLQQQDSEAERNRLLREVLQKLEEQNEQIEEIRLQTGKRTSKGKF